MKGYVYIMSNPSMPGMVKIGRTSRSSRGRASELFQTGVPTPFRVEAEALFPDCILAERELHATFAPVRVSADREFFRMDWLMAEQYMYELHERQIREFVDEFTSDFYVVSGYECVDPEDVRRLARETGSFPPEVVMAISHMTGEELYPALRRLKEFRRERLAESIANGKHPEFP